MKRGTLAQLIEDRSCQNADKIFVTERDGEQLVSRTYAQLKADVDKLALYLRLHVGAGEKIALAGENSYQWILVYLAVIYSGNIILPKGKYLITANINGIFPTNGEASFSLYKDGLQIASSVSEISGNSGDNFTMTVSSVVNVAGNSSTISVRNINGQSQTINNGSIVVQALN